jgi:ribosomal protein S21
MTAENIKVTKSTNENTGAILRKFTQRMRSAGIVQHMRKIRYRSRPASPSVRKKAALRKLERRDEFEKLIKEGKLSENMRGKRVKWGKK